MKRADRTKEKYEENYLMRSFIISALYKTLLRRSNEGVWNGQG